MVKMWKLIDYIMELTGFMSLGLIVYFVFKTYPELPDIIAKHWDFRGNPDRYGPKTNFLTMPIIALFFYIGFPVMMYFDKKKNERIHEKKEYIQLVRLYRGLKIFLIGFFLHHIYTQSMLYLNQDPIIGSINIFIFIGIIFLFVGGILYKGFKMN